MATPIVDQLLAHKLVRFALVGITNTMIDILLFVSLRYAGFPITAANILSTSVALVVSLLLNHKYTFQSKRLTRWDIVLYIVVTIIGIWILQPIVISVITNYGLTHRIIVSVAKPFGLEKLFLILVPKLAATAVTLVWNYVWYNKVVFRHPPAVVNKRTI
jgi:putative flippase GtrA